MNDLFEKPIDFLHWIHFKHKSLLFNVNELEFNIKSKVFFQIQTGESVKHCLINNAK
jgi:hypothetical protein